MAYSKGSLTPNRQPPTVRPSSARPALFPLYANYEYIQIIAKSKPHSGNSSALFYLSIPYTGALTFGPPLTYSTALGLTAGKKYVLSFFSTPNNVIDSSTNQVGTLLSAYWNDVDVLDVQQPANIGTNDFSTYYNSKVEVLANGLVVFFFKAGVSTPHNLTLDDVALFEKWY